VAGAGRLRRHHPDPADHLARRDGPVRPARSTWAATSARW
jgi:hypothetical protein